MNYPKCQAFFIYASASGKFGGQVRAKPICQILAYNLVKEARLTFVKQKQNSGAFLFISLTEHSLAFLSLYHRLIPG